MADKKFLRDLFHRAPVFVRRWPVFLVIALYSTLVVVIEISFIGPFQLPNGQAIAVVNGLIFGLLLAFRTNTAYDRWWEGRKLWGQLVNDSRNLAIKTRALAKVEPAEMKRFGHRIIDFSIALKNHLRRPVSQMPDHGDRVTHEPMKIAGEIYEHLKEWKAEGGISEIDFLILDPHCRSFMDVCGACERIRATPLSVSYRLFLRQGIALYVLTLPWLLAVGFDYWTAPITLVITYFMLGIEMIAEDVEEPFGKDGDDLKLDDICLTIGHSVRQILHIEAGTNTTMMRRHSTLQRRS